MTTGWPALDYQKSKATLETLHMWLQIVGKFKLCKTPWTNHSWHSSLYVTSRGISTGAIPLKESIMTIDFDFIDHQVVLQDSLGRRTAFYLRDESVAQFYEKFTDALMIFEVRPTFNPTPNEVVEAIPFDKDETHKTYNRQHAFNLFQAMVRVNNVLNEFRSDFVGKSSPVHLFWGSFDLACTRFSGRRAPEHPGGVPHLSDEVVKEAYSHEVMSCGFWPGNEQYPEAAFYAYAYPEPDGFSEARVLPPESFYHNNMREFILPYESVRSSMNPVAIVKTFFNTCYRAAANLGDWDRDILEVSPHLIKLKSTARFSSGGEATIQ
jgi:hypothetical protein